MKPWQLFITVFLGICAPLLGQDIWTIEPTVILRGGELYEHPTWELKRGGDDIGYVALKHRSCKVFELVEDCYCDDEDSSCDCSTYMDTIAWACLKGNESDSRGYFYGDADESIPLGAVIRHELTYWIYQSESCSDGALTLVAKASTNGGSAFVVETLEGETIAALYRDGPWTSVWTFVIEEENELCTLLLKLLVGSFLHDAA